MAEQENGAGTEAARLRKLVSRKKLDALEAAWTEAVENDSVEPDDLLGVVDKLARSGETELAESLLWFLLTERAERKGAEDALDTARKAVALFPESTVLREETASLYRAAHAAVAGIETLTERTVANPDVPLPAAVERVDRLLALRPGRYVLDTDSGRPGRVAGFDDTAGAVEVSFADGAGTYDLSAAGRLEPLEADDFRALLTFDPAKLRALADEDPGELVTRILRAFGPRLTFKGLKARLAEVVPQAAWPKWWAAARPRLRRAQWIQMSDAAQPAFALRSRPIPYEACLKAQFTGAGSAEEKLVIVLDYLNEKAADPDPELLGFFARGLKHLIETPADAGPALALGAVAVAAELHKKSPDAVPPPEVQIEPLLSCADPSTLMSSIHNDTLACLILAFIRDALPTRWQEVAAALMPGCPSSGCQWIARELSAGGHVDELRAAVAAVLGRPERRVSALAWLWQAVCGGEFAEALAEVDPVAVAVNLFSVAHALTRAGSRAAAGKEHLLPQVRAAVSAQNYAPLQRVLEKADVERARRIKNLVERRTGLSDTACRRVHEVLRTTHPELFVDTVEPWEEDAIYTTAEGLKKRQAELRDLVNDKLREASTAVGKAAEDGDLSENFGWAAALAERDRLAGTATRMQEEIAKAKIIGPELAQSNHVTVGSAVTARDLNTGQVETAIFLGPWDTDHDKGVHSYRAKLGMAFMGKRAGDHINVEIDGQNRAWEILEVRPVI